MSRSRLTLGPIIGRVACCALLAFTPLLDGAALAASADPLARLEIDIPATKFVLGNGLTVVVHEDHRAPLVAVHIWYHVGSKDEPPGKTGFAHLFEHLMFNGSEHYNDDFFKATHKIGATDQNGTTNNDRTNYFQTVPREALDSILWLESDRMGHLLGVVDQARLDEQRAVVKNEKRQRLDNAPYGQAWELITRGTTPSGHPYDHLTIGSMADLDAASLEDVKQWFRAYYGPSNAVLVLAGDITPEEARVKAEKFFGDIPPGAPVSRPSSWIVKRTGTVRDTAYDRVAQARLYRVWNTPEYASPDGTYLQFLAGLLARSPNSRLHKRLVIEEQLATAVSAEVDDREIGGQFLITADVKPGVDIAQVERVVEEEIQRLIARGPTQAEMARVRATTLSSIARALESIAVKANFLAESTTYLGRPDGWKAELARFKGATASDIQRVTRTWLGDGDYVLHVLPFGQWTAGSSHADRSSMPLPGAAAAPTFPDAERVTLSNGMKLIVARRTGVPVVNFMMLVRTGVPEDFAQIRPGTGRLAMNLLDEGTENRTREQIADTLGALGATLVSGGGDETSFVTLSALKPAVREALAVYADVVMRPSFAQPELDRVRSQLMATIAATKDDAEGAAQRVLPSLLFGPASPYGRIVLEPSLQSIDRAQIAAFHRRWFHPNNVTLIVTGDMTVEEAREHIEAAFKGWQPAPIPKLIQAVSAPPSTPVVYLLDKPGAAQSVVQAALIAPPRTHGDEIARQAMNAALGGSFTSRLNMRMREERGWAYGARSGIGQTLGSRVFVAGSSVQADKTAESMSDIASILRAAHTDRQITEAELLAAKDHMSLGLSGDWSTNDGVTQYLADQTLYELPADYYANYPRNVAATALTAVNAAARELIADKAVTWVVVGDVSKFEAAVRALKLGEVRVIDADGKRIR
jgi:zinc protease